MARLFSAPSHTMTLAYTCSFFLLAPFLLGSLSCLLLVAVLGVTLMAPLAFAALCALSLLRIARQLPQNDVTPTPLCYNDCNAAWESRSFSALSNLPTEPRHAAAFLEPAPTAQARGLASRKTLQVLVPDSTDSDDDSAHPGSAPALSPASSAPCDSPQASRLSTPPTTPDAPAGPCRETPASAPCHEHYDAAAGPGQAQRGAPAPPVLNAPMDGSWLATCQYERRLGQGASGHVDQVLVRPPGGSPFLAARKRMPVNRMNAVMLADEVAALRAGAGCPNIVQLYDLRTTDSHVELLMELVGGGTVAEELAASQQQHGQLLSADRLRQIATDCLQGLDHLHRRGYSAGDVKPQNLLVRSAGGQVVLADFGFSTRSDSSGRLQSQVWAGTYGFMAPEAQVLAMMCDARPTHQLQQQQMQRGHGQQQGMKRPAAGCGGGAAKQQPAKCPVLTVKMDVWTLGKSLLDCAEGLAGPGGAKVGTPGDGLLRAFLDSLLEPLPAKRPTAGRALLHPFVTQQQQQLA